MTQLASVSYLPTLITDLHPVVEAYEGFRQSFSLLEAKCALAGQPAYTHLVVPADFSDRFIVVFMGQDGRLDHHFIRVTDPEYAIFRNAGPLHVGSLVKVIRDVMGCPMNVSLPSSPNLAF